MKSINITTHWRNTSKSNIPPKTVETLSSKLINIYDKRLLGSFPELCPPMVIMYLQELCFKGISITHHLLGWEMTNRGQCKWSHLWNKKLHLTDILLLLEHIKEINQEGSKEFRFFETPVLGIPTQWRLGRWILGTEHIGIAVGISKDLGNYGSPMRC